MEVMQVFDCQDMPAHIRKVYYRLTEDYGNDVYLPWELDNSWQDDSGKIIDNWLRENGATDSNVLIKHWW